MSENIIFQKFEHLFGMAEGLIVVAMFASNIARMSQVFKLVQKMGKRILLSGRTMEQNVRLGTECGYIDRPESVLITADEIDTVPRNQIIVLSTGSQGEYRSGLIRMSNGEHSQIKLQEGDLVLMSSKFIPGNEKAIGRMVNNLFKQGAEVLYEAVHDLHVSGHATRPELKQMIELTRPKYFLPIHGEYRHLVHHSKLAQECGMNADHVLIAINGDLLELTKDRFEIVEHFEELKVLVEGREGGDITKLVLRERRQMGETGVVFALCVRNLETGRIISGPEILFRGLVEEGRETDLIAQSKRVAQKIIVAYEQELREGHPKMDLQETIRVDLRRFFLQVIGKKPVVLPIVLDL